MKLSLPPLLGALALFSPFSATAASLSITSADFQTVGSTATISDSGSKDNTTSWNTGLIGQFQLIGKDGTLYGMRVSASDPTGTLSAGTDSLMIAQTVNSQGLTDTGTLSVYVNPGSGASATSGDWSLNLNFSFYNADFSSPVSIALLLTSLDIDWDQKYYTDSGDFTSNHLYAGSKIGSVTPINSYTGFTAAGDSTFNNPKHAVSSTGTGSSFDVKIAHDEVALYMFEFRDPSQIVPEPGTAMAAVFGAMSLLFRRRKQA